MKRIISFALCIVMCFSLVSANTLTAFAATSVTAFFDVTSTCVENGEISFVVRLKPNVERFNGTVLKIEFDDSVLEVKEATPVYVQDNNGNTKLNVFGEYAHGFVSGKTDVYSVAYMCNNGVSTTADEYKPFFKITFNVLAQERPVTDVNIYCEEFSSNDNIDNEVRPSDVRQIVLQSRFSTLEAPKPVSAELMETGILFTWEQVPGAEKYSILRKADNEGVWEKLGEVTEGYSAYLDTDVYSGVTYTYTVRSGNGYGDSTYYTQGVKMSYL
ncbi:MAG: fibronectin type III domain-containing protein, partial [Clostridia bacterium]|nr:fibronectin type III domain-containing protein [Clostridia bacterium]